MQDRFKFRVWLKDTNKMYNVHSLHIGTNKAIISSRRGNVSIYINKNSILMQSTGLKDKNGKLIYEGDIVEVINCRGANAVVEYNLECATFILKGKKFAPSALQHIREDFFEIIGNIYENPELLENKQ